jgi:hypothetical protein
MAARVSLLEHLLFYLLIISVPLVIHVVILRYNELEDTRVYRVYRWTYSAALGLFAVTMAANPYLSEVRYSDSVTEYDLLVELLPVSAEWLHNISIWISGLSLLCLVGALGIYFVRWSYECADEFGWLS